MNRISERVNIAACLGLALLILLPIGRAEGASDNASKLLNLATKKFGTLTETEERMFRAAANAELADCSDSLDKNNDPNDAEEWDEKTRVIRAKCIAWLCTDPEASALVTNKGIVVKGARIDGQLNLSYSRVSFPLDFDKSAFPGGINIRYAEIRQFFLIGTHTGPIYGDGVKIEGHVFLRNGFKAEGEVRLIGATIGGNLECDGSQFINKGAKALNADGANIDGSVFLRNGSKAEGEVRLLSATIGRNLECDGSQFINPGRYALNADGVKIEGHVFLRNGFKAEGEVRMIGATIGEQLVCEKGMFINTTGCALGADNSNIKGGVYLRKGFKAEGVVSLAAATIDSSFAWTDVNSPEKATLDLRSATVGTLWDDHDSWPDEGKLFLHGLVYKEIAAGAPRDAESRIDWLHRQPKFLPQPYEQLAKVLRQSGHSNDARKINIALEKDKALSVQMNSWDQWTHNIYGAVLDYGFYKWKPFWWGLVIIILGGFIFRIGFSKKLLRPTKTDIYPKFNSLVYSLDTFVPLIDLHQSKYWLPDANRGQLFNIKGFGLYAGGLLRLYFWIHIIMGWLLTTLLVVGLTGLIRT